jgi:hypothetical protein
MSNQLTIFSIDAWAGYDGGGWQWNNWYKVGTISVEEFEAITKKGDKAIAEWFHDNGYTTSSDMRRILIDDDQYNIVICEKKGGRPLFAIEYGNDY